MSDLTPRLVATDLDGTIVRSDGTISARTAAALERVELAGATLVLVTGRPPRWMSEIVDSVSHRGLAICANGALVYDLHTETIVRTHLIEPDVIAKVVDRLRTMIPDLSFGVEYGTEFAFEARYELVRRDIKALGGRLIDGDVLVSRAATKLLAYHHASDPDSLMDRAERAVGDLVTVTHSSKNALLEMSALGVDKSTGLAELCADLDIPASDVVAFGDMPNDLPMLTWAGRSYAVANAHPAVLAMVRGHTASNDDDGVAQILETLFP
jgi:Cof subfamily protein (haloacid dehalogenase superfamily)